MTDERPIDNPTSRGTVNDRNDGVDDEGLPTYPVLFTQPRTWKRVVCVREKRHLRHDIDVPANYWRHRKFFHAMIVFDKDEDGNFEHHDLFPPRDFYPYEKNASHWLANAFGFEEHAETIVRREIDYSRTDAFHLMRVVKLDYESRAQKYFMVKNPSRTDVKWCVRTFYIDIYDLGTDDARTKYPIRTVEFSYDAEVVDSVNHGYRLRGDAVNFNGYTRKVLHHLVRVYRDRPTPEGEEDYPTPLFG